jgi:hypothetical protein
MGSGKTSAIINMINESSDDRKFVFVTPYLSEAERIISCCESKHFIEPQSVPTKSQSVVRLLHEGRNIATTHKLMSLFSTDAIEAIKEHDYTLIIDEAVNVLELLEVTADDTDLIVGKLAKVDKKTQEVIWKSPNYTGKFRDVKQFIENNRILCANCEELKQQQFLWSFPVEIMTAFKDTYVLTYWFETQLHKFYYDINGIEYKKLYVKNKDGNYRLTEEPQPQKVANIKNLIRICDSEKLNDIGFDKTALSATWYERNASTDAFKRLRLNTENYFQWYSKTKSSENMWTTYKKYQTVISGKGYARGFVPCNARATNEFKNKTAVAYLINKYMDPFLLRYLRSRGRAI